MDKQLKLLLLLVSSAAALKALLPYQLKEK
jgi:hypothetical protein